MSIPEVPATAERRRVRVWFGDHVIAECRAEPGLAAQYEAAMSRRFASLRVANEPITAAPLAAERSDVTGQLAPAAGYLRQYRSMTRYQLAQAEKQLAAFAGQQGFLLSKVFVEQLHTDPAAFEALIRSVRRRKIAVVIVPTTAHLSAVGCGETKLQRLHRETGAQALAATGSPP
jgi:hypothetical protein